MSSEIEVMERRRLRLLEGYLLGQLAFIALWIGRIVERIAVPDPPPLEGFLLIGMTLSLLACVTCVATYAVLASRIRHDPDLAEALDNELVRTFFSRSWLAAFVASSVTALVLAVLSGFTPVFRDPLMIALTSIMVGLAAQLITFYCKVRFS